MAPIRVGIIGLAGKDSPHYANGEWGVQHFKALKELPQYELVAICNTSVESASKSIAFHKLDPATVKAYESAKDIASDPNVDLIIVAVAAQYHYQLAKPALENGKNIYVEFPLASTVAECEELVELAKAKGVKAFVGSQAHSDPVMVKLRQILPEIGDVVNTTMLGASPIEVGQGWPESVVGFLDVNSEISRTAIVLGHLLGGFSSVVGEFADLQSVYKTQTKTTTLLDDTFQPSKPGYKITSPDHWLIQGVLKSGATASINLRTAPAPVDNVGFRWTISGTQGEIQVATQPGFIQGGLNGATINLKKRGEEAATVVEWADADPEQVSRVQGQSGQSIARAYAAIAEERTADYATFETGLAVHRAMDRATKGAMWALK